MCFLLRVVLFIITFGVPLKGLGDPLDQWAFRFQTNASFGMPGGSAAAQYGIAFGKGVFVAVGHDGSDFGNIFSSSNGIHWTRRSERYTSTNSTAGELRAIIYTNGTFVAVGWSGAIYSSTNGIDWPYVGNGAGFGLNDICSSSNLFVAVGDYQRPFQGDTQDNIVTSSNGINWVQRPLGLGFHTLYTATYGNGRFVALGADYGLYSANGLKWFSMPAPPTGLGIPRLRFEKGLFIAVGSTGKIMTSYDGLSWFAQTSGTTNRLNDLVCVNGLLIAPGYSASFVNGSNVIGNSGFLTSTNGTNW